MQLCNTSARTPYPTDGDCPGRFGDMGGGGGGGGLCPRGIIETCPGGTYKCVPGEGGGGGNVVSCKPVQGCFNDNH